MNRKNNGKKSIFKIIADIFTWTIFAILMLVAAFLIYYVIANNIYARKGERFKPIVSLYTIISGSMLPTIKVYDVVVNLRIDEPSQLHEGDVITFISQSKINYGDTITHRINKITYDNGTYYFTTKGDNNLVPDETPVEFSNIIGKVILKVPQLGQAQFFLLKQGPKLFLILIPSFGILIYDLLKMLNLFDTKKKVDKSLESKENKLSKQEEEELKEKIRKRLVENDTANSALEPKEEVIIAKTSDKKENEEVKIEKTISNNELENKDNNITEKENNKDENIKETSKQVDSELKTVTSSANLEHEKDINSKTETSLKTNSNSKNKQNNSKTKQSNKNNSNKNKKNYNNRNNTNNKNKKNNNNSKKNNNQAKKEKDNTNLDIDVDKVLKKIKDKNY